MSRLGKNVSCTGIFLSAIIWSSYGAAIHLNQVGFYPGDTKIAVAIGATADSFFIKDTQGTTVYKGILGPGKYWDASNDTARVADFSDYQSIGRYKILIKGCPDSYMFRIAPAVHHELARASIKAFYYNRASYRLESAYAGTWARDGGHPDDSVLIHPSAATESRPAGTTVSSPGGWYDAGDYGKYVVNSGISTNTLFAAYEAFSSFYDTLKLNIPESGNKVPDILDEVLYNLRWMFTMQDPVDGGVYHKLTTANFCGSVMPAEDRAPRYVIRKSTAATLNFAAVTAQAYRVLKKFNKQLPGLADTCLQASLRAWVWARQNPDSLYNQDSLNKQYDPDIHTGPYADKSVNDEFTWAATELYISTKQDSFFTIAYPSGSFGTLSIPGWPNVATLGVYSLFLNMKDLTPVVSRDSIVSALIFLGTTYANRTSEHPYRVSMQTGDYYWGSNSVAANQGIALIFAYLASSEQKFKTAAMHQLDYLLGRNPTGYSYVTAFGTKTPRFIHHRPSEADSIDEPVPGFLAGGPNSGRQDEKHGAVYESTLPALSYVDMQKSYASNEVAINWNAPLAFLSGAVEVLQQRGSSVSSTVKKGKK